MFGRKGKDRKGAAGNPLASRVVRGDDRPTQPLPDAEAGPAATTGTTGGTPRTPPTVDTATAPISAEPETRLVAPPDTPTTAEGEPAPVGVLLVLRGPGTGRLIGFGAGRNGIGRDDSERVPLNFGDGGIARTRHAIITYDDRNGHFYLQPGEGPALTYLDGEPLLEPRRLASGARFKLGATELLFRPLVGEDFSWTPSDA